MSGKHRRFIARRRRGVATVTSATLAAGGLVATAYAVPHASWEAAVPCQPGVAWAADTSIGLPGATGEHQVGVADRSQCGRHTSGRAPAKHVVPSEPKHAAPGFPAASLIPATAPAPSVPTPDYIVVSGDTLTRIASIHRVPGGWQQLYHDNRDTIADPNVITVGQRLRVQAGAPGGVNAPAIKPPGSAVAPAAPAQTQPGVAARAVGAALAQLGTPYVYGGSAPGGFDCSGLVKWTYQKAGLTLPRTAAAQATAGRPVSLSNLQPGDLLFFYRPVSHVVIYVGDGKIAEASQPGTPVHVRSMYLNGFVGARRVV